MQFKNELLIDINWAEKISKENEMQNENVSVCSFPNRFDQIDMN